jgi:hypothetical protein
VQLRIAIQSLNSAGPLAPAGLTLALWLAMVVLSFSPVLHQLIHPDSQSAGHECLVTHFAKGHVLSDASVSLIPIIHPVCVVAPLPVDLRFVLSPEYRLSPSRAPPTLSST